MFITKKIYVESFGCSRRSIEVMKLRDFFRVNEYEIVSSPKGADYILISTCAFRKKEESESIARLQEIRRRYGDCKIFVYGCLPDIAPTQYTQLFGDIPHISPQTIDKVDHFFPGVTIPLSKVSEVNKLNGGGGNRPAKAAIKAIATGIRQPRFTFFRASKLLRKLYIKENSSLNGKYQIYISRGCVGTCTYCSIRKAVGNLKSKPVQAIIDELKHGMDLGYSEFVLLGDDVGAYGLDCSTSFQDLLSCLIQKVGLSETERLEPRVSPHSCSFYIEEIHPHWLLKHEDNTLKLLASQRIKSIIIPIQSGNTRILKLMHREHDSEALLRFMERTRKTCPNIFLASQIIVGFPSETDAEFQDTITTIEKSKFDIVTFFLYDEKENTVAQNIFPKVPNKIALNRAKFGKKYLEKRGIKVFADCAASSSYTEWSLKKRQKSELRDIK